LAHDVLKQDGLGAGEVLHALELLLVEEPHLARADAPVRVQVDTPGACVRSGEVTVAVMAQRRGMSGQAWPPRAPSSQSNALLRVLWSFSFTGRNTQCLPEPVLECCIRGLVLLAHDEPNKVLVGHLALLLAREPPRNLRRITNVSNPQEQSPQGEHSVHIRAHLWPLEPCCRDNLTCSKIRSMIWYDRAHWP
jgi:hypothetical protein